MEYTKLGRIRPVYKGAWSASAAYTALDIVKNAAGDRAYIAVKDVPKGTMLTNAAYWGAVLDVSDLLAAADAAISAANEAARLAPKPLALTEKSNPAVIWPEEGSLLRPTVSILPIQSGSGDPSPTNVRRISGRTAVTVTLRGADDNSKTYAISLGQTVYGGVLNVQYGVLTITRVMTTLNGSEAWQAQATGKGYRMKIDISDIVKAESNSANADIICSDYKTITANQSWNDDAYGVSQGQNWTDVFFNDAVYAASGDVAAWKAYLAGHPVQLCYRLAEPVVVQIDPTAIPALTGQNTVFSDGDQLDLTYNKSLVREREELLARIAALESAAVNNA